MNSNHPTHMAKQTSKTNTVSKTAGKAIAAVTEASEVQILMPVIYLGIDVHLRQYVVCRKIDGATPQPAQRMTPEEFALWVLKQKALAQRVVCCYEAGPFGYTLQRRLTAQGITCYVVRAQDWDKHGQRVKTDGRDARELVEVLARYDAGNKHAMAVVRVPTVEQEQRRVLSRQRESFVNEVRRLAAVGRSHGMSQGYEINGRWWRPGPWAGLGKKLPELLKDLLAPLRAVLLQLEEIVKQRTGQIEAQAAPVMERPKGLGALTEQIIANEVLDWGRFNNRRQVSSYTGLCPSEHSSGGNRRQGSINKHGNPRLRHALVEAVWRLIRLQPGWKRLDKVRARLVANGGQSAPSKKKLAVALARELAVDLWRLNTGRCTLADLGFAAAAQAA
jgi:transposase